MTFLILIVPALAGQAILIFISHFEEVQYCFHMPSVNIFLFAGGSLRFYFLFSKIYYWTMPCVHIFAGANLFHH